MQAPWGACKMDSPVLYQTSVCLLAVLSIMGGGLSCYLSSQLCPGSIYYINWGSVNVSPSVCPWSSCVNFGFVNGKDDKGTYRCYSPIIAHQFPHYCTMLFPLPAHKNLTVTHCCFLAFLQEGIWGSCKWKSNLGYDVCNGMVLCACWYAAIGFFLCNEVRNDGVNRKWWTQITSISCRPQSFAYLYSFWRLEILVLLQGR
jgi:hypothetical protein